VVFFSAVEVVLLMCHRRLSMREQARLAAAGASPVTVVVGQPEELDRQLRPIGIVEPQVVGLACDAVARNISERNLMPTADG